MSPSSEGATERSKGHLLAFFVTACVLSWLNWGMVLASTRGWLPFRFPLNPWGSFGPAAAALLVCGFGGGRAGVKALLLPLLRWRFGLGWWGVVLLGPAALVGLSAWLYALADGQVLPAKSPDFGQLLLLGGLLLIVGGPVGEEVGWRGYALPESLRRTGPVVASLVVAAMWALWHVPLFWLPGAAQEGSSFVMFVALVVAFSILTTWVFLATSQSLLAAILFHHSINMSTYFLPSVFPALASAAGFDRIFMAVTWVAAGGAILALSRQAPAGRPADSTVA